MPEGEPAEEGAHVPQRGTGLLGEPDGVAGVAGMADRHQRQRQVRIAHLRVVFERSAAQNHALARRASRGDALAARRSPRPRAVLDQQFHDRAVERHRDARVDEPPARAAATARRPAVSPARLELAVADVPGAREMRPGRQHPAECVGVDRRACVPPRTRSTPEPRASSREHLEHGTAGLPEAERIEMLDRPGPSTSNRKPPEYRQLPPPAAVFSTITTRAPASWAAIAAPAPAAPKPTISRSKRSATLMPGRVGHRARRVARRPTPRTRRAPSRRSRAAARTPRSTSSGWPNSGPPSNQTAETGPVAAGDGRARSPVRARRAVSSSRESASHATWPMPAPGAIEARARRPSGCASWTWVSSIRIGPH